MSLLRLLLHRVPLLCCLLLAPELQLSEGSTQERRQLVQQSCRLVQQSGADHQGVRPTRQSEPAPVCQLPVRQPSRPTIESDWLIGKRLIELLQ